MLQRRPLSLPNGGFGGQPVLVGELLQSLAAFYGVGSAGPPDFGLAFGTELHRLPVAFLAAARPIHAAFVGGAMRDAEHVAGLVNGSLERAAEAESIRFVTRTRVAISME